MEQTLRQFTDGNLFAASDQLLSQLNIKHTQEEPTPMQYADFYESEIPQYVQRVLRLVNECYYIGEVCDDAINDVESDTRLAEDLEKLRANAHYQSMMLFAIDLKPDAHITRTDFATLTRAFNRLVYNFPVTVIFRQGHLLSIGTCERTEFKQEWKQGQGEKLGKVSLLRNVDCRSPHRGHLMILESIGDKTYPTFDDLYANWQQVFSSELLTKKFYGELSDWYAWAVQVARFPNDLSTTADDEKFNHESCIRLITRLIFVWFLKQKHLIPEEFFDVAYIREHFIEEFNPHDRENLLYNPEKSRYYRLILQNLFFAMLNRPIVPEGKDTPNNRRFRVKGNYRGMNPDYAVNNLLRYEGDFKQGGAAEFLQMANSSVPFLNGGLFDCLDDKPKNLYYDGFSERKESLEQLYLPDWLFFGDEVGRSIDLSEWYGDAKKKKVSARGIIDILKRYNFTIEENTPLDQEVSLDPELLGKAFENLLASYNPETKTSARKQTGSFYTPREIVQYMVDESLVAHLKRTCGDELEPQYRALLSYATEETTLDASQRRQLMQAIYNCRVLDPACGSGAFPMGVLQQMVHVLRQLDPTNEMWKDFMIDLAIEQSRKAFSAEEEEERKARLADIEEAFDKSINDADYARKLYLIEHCIFGVDIQPIAVQISKLRFFISLVVDQKPTNDAVHNFGIRPLPNLESKFVAANTLIPVDYDASLFESTDAIISKKEELRELNHQIFLAKRNIDKQRLKDKIKSTRKALAKAIEDTGFVNPGAAQQLADWDMFEQNTHAEFFDAEWMFGVKGGFDIVIGNPPYINIEQINAELKQLLYKKYETCYGRTDIYIAFIEKSIDLLSKEGINTFIIPYPFTNQNYAEKLRMELIEKHSVLEIVDTSNYYVFENATVKNIILRIGKKPYNRTIIKRIKSRTDFINDNFDVRTIETMSFKLLKNYRFETKEFENILGLRKRIDERCFKLEKIFLVAYGVRVNHKTDSSKPKSFYVHNEYAENDKPFTEGKCIERYFFKQQGWLNYCPNEHYNSMFPELFENEKIMFINVVTKRLRFAYDNENYYNSHTVINCVRIDKLLKASHISARKAIRNGDIKLAKQYSTLFILGLMNSMFINWYWKNFQSEGLHFFPDDAKNLPIPYSSKEQQLPIIDLVDQILSAKKTNPSADTSALEQQIDLLVYHLYGLTYDEVLIVDPATLITKEEYDRTS